MTEFYGKALTFGKEFDNYRKRFRLEVGCFDQFLSELGSGTVPLVDSHCDNEVVGECYVLTADSDALYFKARFFSSPAARELETKVSEGVLSAVSAHWDGTGRTVDGVSIYRKAELVEISVVASGADSSAFIKMVGGPSEWDDALAGLMAEVKRSKTLWAITD